MVKVLFVLFVIYVIVSPEHWREGSTVVLWGIIVFSVVFGGKELWKMRVEGKK